MTTTLNQTETGGLAKGPSAALPPERLVEMYRAMVLARLLDERGNILNRQGRLHFIVSTQGHEAAQVGAAFAMRPGHDYLLAYYRSAPMVLALGMSAYDVFLNLFGRPADPSGGGTNVPGQFASRELNIVSTSNVIATQIPHAVGVGHALAYRRSDAVAVSTFGEGTTSAGGFHEGLNWAGVHRLPCVFICENNGYAVSVPQHKQMAVKDVAIRAEGYGMPGVVVDGMDVLATYDAVKAAIDRARAGEGPTLIEAKVYRYQAHSSSDDEWSYRTREDVEATRKFDPIVTFARQLREQGVLSEADDTRLKDEVRAEVEEAAARAEETRNDDPSIALRHVFKEVDEGGAADCSGSEIARRLEAKAR
jgi:2-oxoisovalerate dehydrogenase E1 component alpha subunit